MLHSIMLSVKSLMASNGMPMSVVYAPENVKQTVMSHPHVSFSYDGSDTVAPPAVGQQNPRNVFRLWCSCQVLIYARSTKKGPSRHDHDERAYDVLSQILLGLQRTMIDRNNSFRPGAGHFLSPAELDERDLLGWSGVVYEYLFEHDRGVQQSTYAGEATQGEAAEEATAGGDTGFSIDGTTIDTTGTPVAVDGPPSATTRIEP